MYDINKTLLSVAHVCGSLNKSINFLIYKAQSLPVRLVHCGLQCTITLNLKSTRHIASQINDFFISLHCISGRTSTHGLHVFR